MTIDLLERTVAELVRERPSRSRVLQRHGLEFCCGGGLALREACERHGLDSNTVLRELEDADNSRTGVTSEPLEELTLTALVANIVEVHHAHLRVELPRLAGMLERVCHVHGDRDSRLREMLAIFQQFSAELMQHMLKEERILFPAIVSLETGTQAAPVCFPSVAMPIGQMEAEHGEAALALEKLRRLSDDFTPPEGACNTWRAVLDGLQELAADMQLHIHKENDVLFARAMAQEKTRREGGAS